MLASTIIPTLENLANRKKADWFINFMYIAYTFSSTLNKFETYNCVIVDWNMSTRLLMTLK